MRIHELEINKKKSREAWKNKIRKCGIGMKDAKDEAQGACKSREHKSMSHVRHGSM